MPEFDFKRFHIRSMNATDEERAAINQELKNIYAALPEEDKADFNAQLQTFLVKEVARVKSDYDSIRGFNNPN